MGDSVYDLIVKESQTSTQLVPSKRKYDRYATFSGPSKIDEKIVSPLNPQVKGTK